ncbi:MAG: FtsX-like permease family protein [Pseudonocardia sp.]|nr:FtsX-like permease family protein [Pseudonocardia sp.]
MGAVRYRLRALLRSGWPGAVGVAIVVAIFGGLALTLVAGSVRTLSAPDRYQRSLHNQADVELQQQQGPPLLGPIRRLPAVHTVDMASFTFGALLGPDGKNVGTFVFSGSSDAFGDRLVEGRLARPIRPDDHTAEFVGTRRFIDLTHASLGAHFRLVTVTKEAAAEHGFDAAPHGPQFDAVLVGILDGPAELSDDGVVVDFPPSLAEVHDVGIAASVGLVGLAKGATLADLRTQVAGLSRRAQVTVAPAQPVPAEIRQAVSAQGQGLAILALIAAITTMIVLGQLLTRQYRMAEDERRVLRSLGYSRVQLAAEPAARATVAVGAGAVLAGFVAFACSALFPRGFVNRLEPHPGRLFNPLVHLLGPVLLLVMVVGWMTVSLLIGDRPPAPVRSTSLVDRVTPAIPSATTALGVHFAFSRGTARGRTVWASFVGLILIAGVVVGALTFGRNLTLAVDQPARYGVNYDIQVGQGGTVTAEQLAPLVRTPSLRHDISGITLFGATALDAGRYAVSVVGMQPLVGDLGPQVLSGELPATPGEIALGPVTARRLHVGIGDTVTLTPKSHPHVLRVTALIQPSPVGSSDLIGDGSMVTLAGLRLIAPDTKTTGAIIKLAPHAPADTNARIAHALGTTGVGPGDAPPSIINIDRVRSIPFLIAAVVGALGLLSLTHQLLVGVRRRRLDLAVLRALGTSKRGTSWIIHMQATLVTLAVMVVAVPLGIAAGFTVFRPYVHHIGTRDDLVMPLSWALAAAVGLIVLANVVAAVPAWRARRTSPSRALARA